MVTRSIPLTRGAATIVDDQDYDWLSQHNWYLTHYGYAARHRPTRDGGGAIYMHRAILGLKGRQRGDHIDGDRLNNTRSNLRYASVAQNGWNVPKTSRSTSSQYKGVTWHSQIGKWLAQIAANGRHTGLGVYEDEETAALVYDRAARRYHGEYANLNFPERANYAGIPEFPVRAKSGYRGVYWNKKKQMWFSTMMHEGRTHRLGYFNNPEDAARAYDALAIRLKGRRVWLNFPEGCVWP